MSRLQERERNDSQNAVSRATAMAGAEEQCYRRVVDLLTAKMVLLMLMLMMMKRGDLRCCSVLIVDKKLRCAKQC